jgi:ribosomal protein S13
MPLKIDAARVGGVEIPNQKYIEYSLQYIYGVGHTTSKAILAATVSACVQGRVCVAAARRRRWRRRRRERSRDVRGAPALRPVRRPTRLYHTYPPTQHAHTYPRSQGVENKRTKDLSEEELTTLREEVDKYTTEGDLRRFVALNIKRLKEINCYRGRRHYSVSHGGATVTAMVAAGGRVGTG